MQHHAVEHAGKSRSHGVIHATLLQCHEFFHAVDDILCYDRQDFLSSGVDSKINSDRANRRQISTTESRSDCFLALRERRIDSLRYITAIDEYGPDEILHEEWKMQLGVHLNDNVAAEWSRLEVAIFK